MFVQFSQKILEKTAVWVEQTMVPVLLRSASLLATIQAWVEQTMVPVLLVCWPLYRPGMHRLWYLSC
jgi:hypothetical protein